MKAPLIARILGVFFLLAGIAGFIPFVTVPAGPSDEVVTIASNYGFLAAIFPVNVVHDVLHVIFGIWGLAASATFVASVRYCRAIAWIYFVLVVLGAIWITRTLFGILPIYGYDIWLHALIALFAAYGGYGAGSIQPAPEA